MSSHISKFCCKIQCEFSQIHFSEKTGTLQIDSFNVGTTTV
ncbi:hypothetical protein LEP1GSC150_4357 [Leptospira interrogans serovar Copenhageni str. LT2050]|uniref:Uncharacterized protein n=1 Tax=Leptospira interrogans serovar Copenhageni str. LT2050 TaxID=1001598 RepID=M3INM3_LEPIT|nr:hypothetical protein LEP1GSC150_4357 [Leptospira interrogans serovar Copenhageni str. LT2050]